MSEQEPRAVRVLVCEDVPELRQLLDHGLRRHSDVTVVGSAGDAPTALDLARTLDPDVVITDLDVPGGSGDDLVLALAGAAPRAAIVVFSGSADELRPDAANAVRLRADKTLPLDELAAAVADLGRAVRGAS